MKANNSWLLFCSGLPCLHHYDIFILRTYVFTSTLLTFLHLQYHLNRKCILYAGITFVMESNYNLCAAEATIESISIESMIISIESMMISLGTVEFAGLRCNVYKYVYNSGWFQKRNIFITKVWFPLHKKTTFKFLPNKPDCASPSMLASTQCYGCWWPASCTALCQASPYTQPQHPRALQ